MRRITGALLVLAAAAAMAGCTSGEPKKAAPPAGPVPGAGCPNAVASGHAIRFGTNGATNLGGVVFGTGKTGVVLAHQSDGDLCQWTTYAHELADKGYRVLAFDFASYGSSTGVEGLDVSVRNAVQALRGQGVDRVVLMGASMGGTAVVAAAATIVPPVTAVISLSAPGLHAGVDADEGARHLGVPVLYAACRSDVEFAESTKRLDAETPAATRHTLVVEECSGHGVDLLTNGGAAYDHMRAAVTDFLRAQAPA